MSPHLVHFIGACMAEIGANSIRNPFEVVKQQMQIGLDNSLYDTIKSINQSRGLLGLI